MKITDNKTQETDNNTSIDVEGLKGVLKKRDRLLQCLRKANAEIGKLIEENYYLKEYIVSKWSEEDKVTKEDPCENCKHPMLNCQNFPCIEKQCQVKESIISKHKNKTCKEIDDSLTSEDEKIKKEIIEFLKKASGGFLDTATQCKTFGKWLAWFEKQCGQKSLGKSAFEAIKKENQENNVISVLNREVKIDAGGYPYLDCNIELYDYTKDIPLAKKGDKVKIIVVKEE